MPRDEIRLEALEQSMIEAGATEPMLGDCCTGFTCNDFECDEFFM